MNIVGSHLLLLYVKSIRNLSLTHSDPSLQFVGHLVLFIQTEDGNLSLMSSTNFVFHQASFTTPYHPQGNGQRERTNETLCTAINCKLHSRGFLPDKWESVMDQSLASMRCLLSTATNESPHQRFFAFDRRSSVGFSTPKWMQPGKTVYLKQYVRPAKDHPLVSPTKIIETIGESFARVQFSNNRVDTISTSGLAPGIKGQEILPQSQAEIIDKDSIDQLNNSKVMQCEPDQVEALRIEESEKSSCNPGKRDETPRQPLIHDVPSYEMPTLRRGARAKKPVKRPDMVNSEEIIDLKFSDVENVWKCN